MSTMVSVKFLGALGGREQETFHTSWKQRYTAWGTDIRQVLSRIGFIASRFTGQKGLFLGSISLASSHTLTSSLTVQPATIRFTEIEWFVIQWLCILYTMAISLLNSSLSSISWSFRIFCSDLRTGLEVSLEAS